jgi:hypothetical protein
MPNCLLPDFFPAKCGNQRQGSASAAPDIAVTWGAWHLGILEIGENWGPSGPAKSCSNDCDSLIITEKQVFLMQFSQPHLPIGPLAQGPLTWERCEADSSHSGPPCREDWASASEHLSCGKKT